MKILVACEESQVVTKAFRAVGAEAYSCDVLPCSGGKPEWHLQQDVLPLLKDDWDMVLAFPPCFVEDTLVLTKNRGYVEIFDIKIGEEVLTHTGRWKKVYDIMSRKTENVRLIKSSNNLPTLTTNEHPYYVRERQWGAKNKKRIKTYLEPSWLDSKYLTKNHYVGHILPPEVESSYTDEDLWIMGRYVADGHLRKNRTKKGEYECMTLSIGKHKLEEVKDNIITYKFSIYEERTAFKVNFSDYRAIKKFEQFGRGAANKELPTWVLSLPKRQAEIFLKGYLSGDGYENDKIVSSSSVSKKLTLGVYMVMTKVFCSDQGNTPTLPNPSTRKIGKIENRIVDMLPLYMVKMNKSPSYKKTYFDAIKQIAWCPIRTNKKINESHTVYNISVEDDESYTANGVIVHNCTDIAVSGARWFKEKRNDGRQQKSIEFFMEFTKLDCMWAIENPVGIMSTLYRKPDQIIQPWMFGHGETKKTCLWLNKLPKLQATDIVPGREQRIWRMAPSKNRAMERSKTYLGIAKAMAATWGIR